MKTPLIASAAVLALSAGAAHAGSVMYQANIPLQTTNWNSPLQLPQWDPVLFPNQVLTKVTIKLTGNIEGDASAESLDAAPSVINYNVSAQITLTGPGGLNVVVLPLAGGAFNATAFDGVVDFAGTSGFAQLNLMNTDQASQMLTDPPTDLVAAGFVGNGMVNFNLAALGTSSASGPGNVLQQFRTEAGANVMITYEFIPAPGSAALLGLAGMVAGRRRRHA